MTSAAKPEVISRPGSRNPKNDDELRSTSGLIYHRLESSIEGNRISSSLVLAFFCVCSAVALVFALLSISYLSGVESELDALRQTLEKLEEKLNDVVARNEENEISIASETEMFSSDQKPSFLLLAQSPNAGHAIESRGGEEPEPEIEGGDRKRLRRSPVADQTERKRNEQQKAKQKQKAKPTKKQTDSSQENKNSAVHFEPRNSGNRTFTTKRGSPVLDFWETAKWWKTPSGKSFFHIREGVVTILEDGTYLIYVQLVFHDLSGRWSFSVNINDRQELKCINSEHISTETSFHPTNHGVYQHCFSSRLFHVRRLEQVTVRCLYEHRQILLNPEFTFWGIVKMS